MRAFRAQGQKTLKNKLIPMVGLAVVFGGLSIFAADRWVKSQKADEPVATSAPVVQAPVDVARIVVAKNELKYGTVLTADLVQEIDWPANAIPNGAFRTVDELIGDGKRTVLSAFAANEPILPTKLSGKDGRAALSNMLSPGMRAVTVRVDDITGVAGFVTAGDRVDVVLTRNKNETQTVTSEEGSTEKVTSEMASEVILQNVKVLTLDQNADESNTTAQVAKAVTVEVTSADAQKVALAQQLGTLYLLLRPAGEDTSTNAASLTTSDLDGKPKFNPEQTSALPEKPADAAPSNSFIELQPEGPRYRSLIVTRGHTPETYSVIDESGRAIAPQDAQQ